MPGSHNSARGCSESTVKRTLRRYPSTAERWNRLQELADAGRFDEPELMVLTRDARAAAAACGVHARITLETLRSAHIRTLALVTQPSIRDNHTKPKSDRKEAPQMTIADREELAAHVNGARL